MKPMSSVKLFLLIAVTFIVIVLGLVLVFTGVIQRVTLNAAVA